MTETKKEAGKTGKEKEPTPTTEIKKVEPTFSERFSSMVIHEFTGNVGNVQLTAFQKRLIQNYFISIDLALKTAEERRLKKAERYRDALAITWPNVNMESLALNVVACAKIGYDPALPNHINMVPYKNNKTNKYDVGFIEGYRGKELKAKKYGYDMPDHVIVELVYSKDKFTPLKKDINNKIEHYEFKIAESPFDRGDIIGGFYYHIFNENQEKNKIMFYNLAEIEKRKPQYASVEFWGGEKAVYGEDGKKTAQKEKVEGWFPEMCWKTLYRLAYGAITIDSEKIDDNLMRIIENEKLLESNRDPQNLEAVRNISIEENGSKKNLNIQDTTFEEVGNSHKEPEPVQNLNDLGKETVKQTVSEPGY
jgi:recombination protein RecT